MLFAQLLENSVILNSKEVLHPAMSFCRFTVVTYTNYRGITLVKMYYMQYLLFAKTA